MACLTDCVTSKIRTGSPIEASFLERAKKFVLDNYRVITYLDGSDPHFHFYQGINSIVFSHLSFPNLVFKLMGKEQAMESKKSIDVARIVLNNLNLRYAHVPPAEIIDLSLSRTLLVMEKAIGETDELEAQEAMEEEFSLIDTNLEMAAKWRQMTREVATVTALIGYWDAHRKNLIWDSSNGWTFIDFEEVRPTSENIQKGLNHLIEIFPPQFVDEIYDVAEAISLTLKIERTIAKVDRMAQFTLSRGVSQWNRTKVIPRILDKDQWPPESLERKILEEFDIIRSKPYYRNWKLAQTELTYEPNLEIQEALNVALQNLQSSGVVYRWIITEIPRLRYKIYF